MVEIAGKNYLSLQETSKSLCLHRVTVSKLLKTKQLKGFKLASRYLIEPESVNKFLENLQNECN